MNTRHLPKGHTVRIIDRAAEVIESSLRGVVEVALIATDGTAAVGSGTELGDQIREEASTLARALADAGLLTPDLPEPGSGGEWADTRGAWVVSPLQGGTCVHVDDDLTPDETRDLADALYAAADHAEEVDTDGQDN